MRRSIRVRLYPTPAQKTLFARTAGAAIEVYNLGLGVRKYFYEQDGISVSTNGFRVRDGQLFFAKSK